jgi:hypothetical protein
MRCRKHSCHNLYRSPLSAGVVTNNCRVDVCNWLLLVLMALAMAGSRPRSDPAHFHEKHHASRPPAAGLNSNDLPTLNPNIQSPSFPTPHPLVPLCRP